MSAARSGWLAALAPLCAGVASALLSWRQWINPFVDAPREMIVAARLAAGERLYADVAYHYGPAAPWLNAAVLRLFGQDLLVLEMIALAFSILLFWSLFRLTERAGSSLSAAVATTVAAALCLGAPNGGAFLFPYSFGTLYALAGSFLALERISSPPSPLASSLAVGGLALAFASKPEMGAAAAVVILVTAGRSEQWRTALRRAGKVVLFAAILAGLGYAVAFGGLSWEIASPEGPLALLTPPEKWRNVFRVVSGMADVSGSVNRLLTALFLDVVLLGAAALVAARSQQGPPRTISRVEILWLVLGLAAVILLASSAGGSFEDRLPPLLMPMPLVSLAAAAFELRSPLTGNRPARFLLFGFSALFATRVLLGLTYGAYTTPYSILALPGLCATAAVLVLDRLALRFPNAGAFRRSAALLFAALAVVGVARLQRLRPSYATALVKTNAGALRLPREKAFAVVGALEYLRARAEPGDGLVGFPEAGFFHFVTGLRNPFRQDTIYPDILDGAAEERVLRRLQKTPPRFVLLINQPTPAFGPGSFGRDYAVALWAAIERAYVPVAAFGDPRPDAPVGGPRFFIRIYERRPEAGRRSRRRPKFPS